jgi:hypothetical protein
MIRRGIAHEQRIDSSSLGNESESNLKLISYV